MSARHHHLHHEISQERIRKIINNPERDLTTIARTPPVRDTPKNAPQEKDQLGFGPSVDLGDRMASRPSTRLAQLRGESSKRVFDKREVPTQDRRRYNPENSIYTWHYEPMVRTQSGTKAQVVARPKGQFGFRTPGIVGLCVRRKTRRSVLFALRRNGAHHTPRRRNQFSGIGC